MKSSLKAYVKQVWRFPLTRWMRLRLKNKNFILITSNCVGGTLLHDLGLPFNTPTINLTLPQFNSFCEHLTDCLDAEPVLLPQTDHPYPIFRLGDVEVCGVHYKSEQEFLDAWHRRIARLRKALDDGAEILLMAADNHLDGSDAIERFRALPYRKVCFTATRVPYPEFVHIPEFAGEKRVGDLTVFGDPLGRRLFEKHFDCVKFINGG